MAKHSTILRINNGVLENETSWEKMLAAMGDGRWLIEADNSKKRTGQQNRYYWAVVVWEIRNRLEQLGNDVSAENVHDFLKERFNSKPVIGDGGELLGSVGDTTTTMSKEQFGIYLDKIIPWAQDFLGITIPLPNTQMEVFND